MLLAVKTPAGLSERRIVERVVTQGGVTGSVCCAVQTDKMGKDAIEKNTHLYMYNGKVGIPTLAMVDDIAKISVLMLGLTKVNKYSTGVSVMQSIQDDKMKTCSILKAHNTMMKRRKICW